LQVSAGSSQLPPQVQDDPQRRAPVEPQMVVQGSVVSRQHSKPSSHVPSQSSSRPLQVSGGVLQVTLQAQETPQIRVPVEPQVVVQRVSSPWQHSKPLSQIPSQSSSRPLQVSASVSQLPQVQLSVQRWTPHSLHPSPRSLPGSHCPWSTQAQSPQRQSSPQRCSW
jgi:hypothetical protein